MFRRCLRSLKSLHTSTLSRTSSTKQVDKDLYVVADRNNVDSTVDFLGRTFVRNEPVVQAMGIEDHSDLLRFMRKHVTSSLTLKLVDKECNILSVAVCGVSTPEFSTETRFYADCNVCEPRTKRLLNLWADISDCKHLYECLKVDKMWDIIFLATAVEAQGKGFSKLLTKEALHMGKQEGLSIVRMDCTSHFSARIASSLKFVSLPPRHVMTYRDKKGNPWLSQEPPKPHGNVVIAYDFLC